MRVVGRSSYPGRQGAVVLELLIVLPLLVIGGMAAVEMGLWMTGRERLEMATRIGVEEAAASLNFTTVRSKVRAHLSSVNVPTDKVEMLLIHNVDGDEVRLSEPKGAAWTDTNLLPPVASTKPYVRLVVRVPSDTLAPNLLKTFGFDLSKHWSIRAKTHRYEGN